MKVMLEVVAAEAARSVVGSSIGYFIGRVMSKRDLQKRCSFLWDLEMDVSLPLLKKIIDQEVKDGCIKPEEADDRFAKILEVRSQFGLVDGANAFAVVQSQQAQKPVSTPSQQAPVAPSPVSLAKAQLKKEDIKSLVGPPSALQSTKEKKFLGIL